MAERLTIIHTNDLHGSLTSARFDSLARVRPEADLFFDTGDAIKAGNLALPLSPDPVWPRFRQLDITASCPGNRESHVLTSGMQAKLAGLNHPFLCSNWRDRDGHLVHLDELLFECKAVRVGVFAVMVPMVTARMKTQALSAYLWDSPLETAMRKAEELRPKVDLLVALTHIGLTQDRRLAEACPQLDLILGGHSHNVLESPEVVAGVPIAQGGSHGRFWGRYVWEQGAGLVEASLIPWT